MPSCLARRWQPGRSRSGGESVNETVKVTYLEMRSAPSTFAFREGAEYVNEEKLSLEEYLALYRRVGASLRWDQRLKMPAQELMDLLQSSLRIYVVRGAAQNALGFCEFDRRGFPEIELKNFGLVPEAQGHGLGPWLLGISLRQEWCPLRIVFGCIRTPGIIRQQFQSTSEQVFAYLICVWSRPVHFNL
jgi:hypothetical protein